MTARPFRVALVCNLNNDTGESGQVPRYKATAMRNRRSETLTFTPQGHHPESRKTIHYWVTAGTFAPEYLPKAQWAAGTPSDGPHLDAPDHAKPRRSLPTGDIADVCWSHPTNFFQSGARTRRPAVENEVFGNHRRDRLPFY